LHQNTLRDDRDGIAVLGADFEAGARQFQRGFDWLITIGVAGEDDHLAFPGRSFERLTQQHGGLAFDHNL